MFLEVNPNVSWVSIDDLKTGGCALFIVSPASKSPEVFPGGVLYGDKLFETKSYWSFYTSPFAVHLRSCMKSADMSIYHLNPGPRNTTIPVNPKRADFLKALVKFNAKVQAQKQKAEDFAEKCNKGFEQLTVKSDSATLEQRVKDCRVAKAAYEPQQYVWQTKTVWAELNLKEAMANILIGNKHTLSLSTACDLVGKTSRTELRNSTPVFIGRSLRGCKSLLKKLSYVKDGSAGAGVYKDLGVLSASRVQSIIDKIKKADEWQLERVRKAEKEKKKKAAKAGMQFLRGIILSDCASTKKRYRSWGGENGYCKARSSEYRGQISQRNEYNKCKSQGRSMRDQCKKARAPGW
jgi:hypothetical protein